MTTEKRTMHDDALTMVFLRNDFYKKKFYLILLFVGISLVANIVAAFMLLFLIKNPPHPLYFVADPVGRLMEDVPVSEPNMSLDDVTAWVVDAVQGAYTYSYVNYRAELQSAQKYFTTFGWNSYMKALQDSNNLVALTQRKMIQYGVVVERPTLIVSGHMGKAYAYQFRMPVLRTTLVPPYGNDIDSKSDNTLVITVTVVRQDLLQSYKGLGITQMNAELIS